jgi:hypothetical protein
VSALNSSELIRSAAAEYRIARPNERVLESESNFIKLYVKTLSNVIHQQVYLPIRQKYEEIIPKQPQPDGALMELIC